MVDKYWFIIMVINNGRWLIMTMMVDNNLNIVANVNQQ